MTTAQAFTKAHNEIFKTLLEKPGWFEAMHASSQSLIEKWQEVLEAILPIQLSIISKYGYTSDQAGLTQFNNDVAKAAITSSELDAAIKEDWRLLFQKAFEVDELISLTLENAQSMIHKIADAMCSEPFLTKVRQKKDELRGSTLVEIRKALLSLILPLHMQHMESYGFAGEAGYIQARRALMDHFHDQKIMEETDRAQQALFEAAGLS